MRDTREADAAVDRLIALMARLPGLGPRSARRAERGPSPGSRAISAISRSIAASPAAFMRRLPCSERQLHPGRQLQPLGHLGHLRLRRRHRPRLRVLDRGDD